MNFKFTRYIFLLGLLGMGQTCKNRDSITTIPMNLSFEQYEFNDLRIIQDKQNKPVMSVRMTFLDNPSSYSAEEAGISHLAIQWVLQGGPEAGTGKFQSEVRAAGAAIHAETFTGGVSLMLTCARENFKEAWALFVRLISHPAFIPEEFEKIRNAEQSRIKKENETLSGKARQSENENYFGAHSNAQNLFGNTYSLQHLTATAVKNYYLDSLRIKKRMLLVVAGFQDQEKLVQEIVYSLDNLPAGFEIPKINETEFSFSENAIVVNHLPGKTMLLRALISAPSATHRDAPAMQLALRMINRNLTAILQRKYMNASPPGVAYSDGKIGFALLSGETNWPSDWADFVMKELGRAKREGFDEIEIEKERNLLLTDLELGMETSGDLCDKISKASLAGDWMAPFLFSMRLKSLSAKSVNEIFNHHCKAVEWTCTGDSTGLNRKIFLQPLQ